MKQPTAFNRFAPLADPPGPPRAYRVRLQLDVRIDIVVPSATDAATAKALACALWQARRDEPTTLAGFPVATTRLLFCEQPAGLSTKSFQGDVL